MVSDIIGRQQEQAKKISSTWVQILKKEGVLDSEAQIIDQEKFDVIKKDV
jgi:hypothetical protein